MAGWHLDTKMEQDIVARTLRIIDTDDAVARHLHGVRQGINLPLRLEGEIVGVICLTGEPENLRKYGELVCMTAEICVNMANWSA